MPSIPIDPSVPISMHPDILAPHGKTLEGEEAKATPGPKALAAAREALAALYETQSAMNQAEKALNETAPAARRRQTPDGRSEYLGNLRMTGAGPRNFPTHEEEFREAVFVAHERTTMAVTRRTDEIRRYRDGLAAQIEAATTDPRKAHPEALALASEVRAHAKALPDDKRFGFVSQAIAAGDLPTVSAVLHAPPFLSGLDPAQHGHLRVLAAQKFAPQASAQHKEMDAILDKIDTAANSFQKRFFEIAQRPKSKEAKAAEAIGQLKKGKV